MLSAASVARIEQSAGWRQHRIEMIDLPDDGEVVVKGQRPARGPLRYRLLAGLAQLTRNPLLRPVPTPGGVEAQRIETARLRALAAAGVRVPDLLWVGEDYLVMRRISGYTLEHFFSLDPQSGLSAFRQGLDGLSDVHRRGQYLSQGFARNILVSDGALVYIDFEDDPLQAMDMDDARARDVLSYLQSAVWINRAARHDLLEAWTAWTTKTPPAVVARIRHAAEGLGWLRHLPRERKPWGRDVVAVQALAAFLHHWTQSDPVFS